MTFLYTARGAFDRTSKEEGMSWDKYIEWSRLVHLAVKPKLQNTKKRSRYVTSLFPCAQNRNRFILVTNTL